MKCPPLLVDTSCNSTLNGKRCGKIRAYDQLAAIAAFLRVKFGRKMRLQGIDFCRGRADYRHSCDRRLQHFARFKDLMRLQWRGRRDIGTSVGMRAANLATGQMQQSAPDSHATNAKGIAKRRL